MDPINETRTKEVLEYLSDKGWKKLQGMDEFVLFHTNGADRPAKVYVKEIKRGARLDLPIGMVLCLFRE